MENNQFIEFIEDLDEMLRKIRNVLIVYCGGFALCCFAIGKFLV